MHEMVVNQHDGGKRVDNVATKYTVTLKPELGISRSLIQKMIECGAILVNRKNVKPAHKVKVGDRIGIDMAILEKENLLEHDRKIPKPEKLPLDIIYEDEDIIVVNKPAGMVVHPACGNYSGTLVNALLNYAGFLTEFNRPKDTRDVKRLLRPGIVHRLDKGTSGIMLIAKTGPAHRKLAGQLKQRSIVKKYIAVVKGIVDLDEGVINAPISHDKKDRRRMAINEEEGKEAVTYYRVIKRDRNFISSDSMRPTGYTVLEVKPRTGRTHQIRIHLSYLGHPLLGDVLYNGPRVKGLSRHALHAKSISFIHPTKNTPMEFSAKLPNDLRELVS